MTEARRGAGRRQTDRDIYQLLASRNRMLRERVWAIRVLIAAVFLCIAVVSYGITVTLPAVRRAQDQQVCAYRAVKNRERSLAKVESPPAARRRHRQTGDTFAALERVASEGRTIPCRTLINRGRR